jgi:hypothetical protein
LKEHEVWVCTRWGWSHDNGTQRVVCFQWQVKDCSKRLYPNICKLEGRK